MRLFVYVVLTFFTVMSFFSALNKAIEKQNFSYAISAVIFTTIFVSGLSYLYFT